MTIERDPFDFSDLASSDEQIARETIKGGNAKYRAEFDCIECGGSGLWQGGRRNVHGNEKCWTCGGRGKVVTNPLKLRENRAKAAQKKVDAFKAFHDANADVIRVIGQAADWSDFARSLSNQLQERKVWSDKQLASARSMAAKLDAKAAAKAEAKEAAKAAAPAVDLSAIEKMFATALASGYKKPMYRANGLRIKPGKGGSLYVLTENRTEDGFYGPQPGYEGKIETGKFQASRACEAETLPALLTIAADPKGEAIRYGQRTGTCSCCGRELTKHASIEAGIGPICAQKWGF